MADRVEVFPTASRLARAVAVIGATYVYFLIFAEFALIELARPSLGDGSKLRLMMGALGAGGIAGSMIAGATFRRGDWSRRLAAGFTACSLAALCAPWLANGRTAPALAAAVGLSLGFLTVTLAAGLRAATGPRHLGFVAGGGTGLAYALCNVPAVFNATPAAQSGLAAAAALIGALVAVSLRTDFETGQTIGSRRSRRETAAWILAFVALVWMDSAAFYIIQHTDVLRSKNWSGAWTLWGNATMHLAAALIAGVALDRGRLGWVTAIAALALAGACAAIHAGDLRVEIFYTGGVSLYSAALVYFPARTGRPFTAALVFATAGWLASALGIGMAQNLHTVPAWFPVAALSAVGLALLVQRRSPAATFVIALVILSVAPKDARAASPEVARGREVYIAEGCIHCHSQFIRPGTEDVSRWGPAHPLASYLDESPPLFGNRRQGPDLANVGNRRTPEWNRLHLIDPRAISAGSRMPSYAHLFKTGDQRGTELIAYLASLGAGTEEERAGLIAAWRPVPAPTADADQGRAQFTRLCQQCHGALGRGDGALANGLSLRPPDWPGTGWRHIHSYPHAKTAAESETVQLARIIKFGLPGTPMAGHESLDDTAVVSLAQYVIRIQHGPLPK